MAQAILSENEVNFSASRGAEHPIHRLRLALITGQTASLVMLAVFVVMFAFAGHGVFYPVQILGSLAIGERGMVDAGTQAFALGLVLNQVGLTVAWSLVFFAIMEVFRVRRAGSFVLLGLGIGVVAQLIDVELLMAPVMNAIHGHNIWAERVPPAFSWIAHLVFGLSLGFYPAVRNHLDRGHQATVAH